FAAWSPKSHFQPMQGWRPVNAARTSVSSKARPTSTPGFRSGRTIMSPTTAPRSSGSCAARRATWSKSLPDMSVLEPCAPPWRRASRRRGRGARVRTLRLVRRSRRQQGRVVATGAARQRTLTLRQARSNGGGRPATRALGVGLLIGALALCGCTSAPGPGRAGLSRIEHIVVIYAENRSFDHLYGLFPGADGIANATPAQYTQLDHDGTPLTQLPPVWTADGKPDTRFPTTLPNRPFRIDAPPVSKGLDQIVPSPIHQFWQNR